MTETGGRGGSAPRQFLFLQGLAGPFFARLGQALTALGHGVHRVNFNGGDRLCWDLPNAMDYRGGLAGWPDYLARVLSSRGITDIVLFGDCRPLHAEAIKVARRLHLQVHVFEEGYIRPDWVTLEIGGVNGHSSLHQGLPRNPQDYIELAETLPAVETMRPVPSTFRRRVKEDLVYNIGTLLMAALYPGYRTHRPWNILVEYGGWLGRFARKPADRRRSKAALDRLAQDGRPYFVFPLQLDCDYQIRTHSSFSGMQAAIDRVVGSFAADGPADTLLVVKAHPLDNGLRNWRRMTLGIAEKHGVADRLLFLDEGDIATLVGRARGVVTINSTSGTLALACGIPVICLGDAVYNIPGVTFQGALMDFWSAPVPPDEAAWAAFRRVLVHRCLVHGGFFSDEGLDRLVAASVRRLETSPRAAARLAEAAAELQAPYASRATARS